MKIICLGDSMMADYSIKSYPQVGIIEVLRKFFNDTIKIENLAVGKMSTRTCLEYKVFDKSLDLIENDTYVFINFGHNDKLTNRKERYVTTDQFEKNILYMIKKIREKGATPIILSPTNILVLDENNNIKFDNHGEYPSILKKISKRENLLFIDLYQGFYDLFVKYGFENSKRFVMIFDKGMYPSYVDGSNDSHLRYDGAYEISRMIVNSLKENNHPLAKYLR